MGNPCPTDDTYLVTLDLHIESEHWNVYYDPESYGTEPNRRSRKLYDPESYRSIVIMIYHVRSIVIMIQKVILIIIKLD